MSVFTHNHPFYTVPNNGFGNFGSLVRFIDDWDKHFSQQGGQDGQSQSRQGRRNVPTFTPRFDVRETEQAYELHGELPGVDKKDITIEFSDLQTIVIRGNVERTYTEGNVPSGLIGDVPTGGAITAEDDSAETRSNKSFQPTVEDEKEGAAGNTVAETSKNDSQATSQSQQPQQKKSKYWVYERSVGNFSRSFTFSNRVDSSNVKASLENGILTVIVPKAKKPEPRRIAVN